MKIVKYMKKDGAYTRPVYKEVLSEGIGEFKGKRSLNVESIIINYTILADGKTYPFQGDEISQNRLARSGWAMDKNNISSIDWKTFDNQIVQLTVSDIAGILLASGQAQSDLWF